MKGFVRQRSKMVEKGSPGCRHQWAGDRCEKCSAVRRMLPNYTAYWETQDAATGKRRQHSRAGFRRKRDAEDHLSRVVGKVKEGTWRPDKPVTVKELLEDHWLPAKRTEGLRSSSLAQYRAVVEKWIVPQLGAKKAAAVTPKDIVDLCDKLRNTTSAQGRDGLSGRSLQLTVGTLKSAFRWAAATPLLARNPISEVKRPSPDTEGKAVHAWNAETARKFLDHVAEDRLAALWSLALCRGLRRGELAGLQWASVDLDAGVLRIERTRIVVDGKVEDSLPKTKTSRRSIPLDEGLIRVLSIHKATQAEESLKSGARPVHVFTDQAGDPYNPEWISNRWDHLVAAAGVERISLHGARHSAASIMMANGVPPKVVQELLGHSTVSITLDIYSHTAPSMAEAAGAQLSSALGI